MSEQLTKIPLSRLQPSADNVRKTERDTEVAALSASIEAHGLLQNLTVRQVASNGASPKRYEVVAGGRRLQALKLLAKRRRIPKDHPVSCHVLKKDDAASAEVSLAENFSRVPLHPADQFEAFRKLHAEGLGAAEIAARFGVTQTVVEQRLKLAAVSPRLMALYKEGGMTLEQLSAFTITDDHAAQEYVWFEAPLFDRRPPAIRRMLTKALVEGSDRRARLIGAKAYEAAGGVVIRDLFDPDAAYFTDSQLLDRLVAEKLEAEAQFLQQEGWCWVETRAELDYEELAQFGHISPTEVALPRKEQKRLSSLCERHDTLVSELEERPDESAVAELDQIAAEIDALSAKREQWNAEDKARSGVILCLDAQGGLRVIRGLLREQDARPSAPTESAEEIQEPRAGNGRAEYSDALLRDLSAHRTAGLRETLAACPDVALTALVHALVVRAFFSVQDTCVDIRPVFLALAPLAEGIEESSAVAAMAKRHQDWAARLPEPGQLWEWLAALTLEEKLELLAYLVGRTANAVRQRHDPGAGERLAQADLLAEATSLDMSKWWCPTRESYFDWVSRQRMLEAVSDAVSPAAAQAIAHMKKPAMASRAEQLLKDSAWLPEPLRSGAKTDTCQVEDNVNA